MNCKTCKRELTGDEIAIYKRLVNRSAHVFLCKTCLAAFFKCAETKIDEKIFHFRNMGCTLFD